MIITTGNDIQGYVITEYLGVVRGIIVRSTGFTKGLIGTLRSIWGGNIPEYASVCEEARRQAYDLLIQHAQERGADAIIAMRYDATEFTAGTTEVLAYGTAVKCHMS
ncbi:MAG: YbjQ family protein [Planctomycetota bacterium]